MHFDDEGTSVATAPRGATARPSAFGDADRLLASLLAEQGDLTAVERFEQFHREASAPLREPYYTALLPASAPGPGEQLAFEVDLSRCSGCKACVAACHALNGLDERETWRDVGLLVGGTPALPVVQHVTTACHHCVEPACMSACPVDAYEKDPITGIVRHLDDQCFGCRYCTLACPYDVPKYQPSRGIVRKCDMCADRLKVGEAPACVQACPHEAIRIRVVSRDEVRARAEGGDFVADAHDPSYTLPTTTFLPAGRGELRAADGGTPHPEHGHPPLTAMLVLTQLAAGGFVLELLARLAGSADGVCGAGYLRACLALGLAGLAASLAHLGRPLYAYRAILGVRHSWLSREAVALGAFAKAATAYVAVEDLMPGLLASPGWLRPALLAAVATLGVAGVGCSAMVYHAVRRRHWHASIAGWKFAGTAAALGLATAVACLAVSAARSPGEAASGRLAIAAGALAAAVAAKLAFEARDLRGDREDGPLGQAAWLLRGPLRRLVAARTALGVAGGMLLPLAAAACGVPTLAAAAGVLTLLATTAGEMIERHLFFVASPKPRMPGGLPS
jgi:formate dehydrogenase iron-sulfur subunit